MKELVRLLVKHRFAEAGGVQGSFGRFLAARLQRELACSVLFVTAEVAEAERAAEDIESFLGEEGPPVRVFPRREDEREGQRLHLLHELLGGTRCVVAASLVALWQPVLEPEHLRRLALELAPGDELAPEALAEKLEQSGYESVRSVTYHGEYSRRGGLLDLFGHGSPQPLRIEYFGDTIESIRSFDPSSQVSIESLPRARISLAAPGRLRQGGPARGALSDYFDRTALRVLAECPEINRLLRGPDPATTPGYSVARKRQIELGMAAGMLLVTSQFDYSGPQSVRFQTRSAERFAGDLAGALSGVEALAGRFREIHIYFDNAARRARLLRLLEQSGADLRPLVLHTGRIAGGFELPDRGEVHLPYHALFGRDEHTPQRHQPRVRVLPAPAPADPGLQAFLSFSPGDLVVHQLHGIGRFRGLGELQRDGLTEQMLILEYAGGTLLHLPVTQAELVGRYIGAQGHAPRLDRLGGKSWARKKQRVEAAVNELAAELLELQAVRAARPGIAHPPTDALQQEFAETFPFEETPDQRRAADAIEQDMCAPRTMDRLLCGDVGFGKTEVALRAAYRAICGGRQVALLVPTTVLAEQHLRTMRERFEQHPVRVEALSRFRSPAERKALLEALAAGRIDLLIGTHRLLRHDVRFTDLGLVIVDEEQRFGVQHKQRLRRLRSEVDVLTLSATPIPRTLHMALVGLRNISTLATPPRDRLPILTRIAPYNESLVREGLLRELQRQGQALFVHNRVGTIEAVAERLRRLAPEARFAVGHGQLAERALERVMLDFVAGKVDVLVTTTIVESGLDIPSANTIFIDRADRFGTAELHQLRGRVGRCHHQAYAYLLVPPGGQLTGEARRRLRAVAEHSELGGGFELAMRDLELRGAGNLLGAEQSGHMASVGYATYCRLLEQATVRLAGGAPARPERLTSVDLSLGALLPADYVPREKTRIEFYSRLSRVHGAGEVDAIAAELRDRFGPPPEPVRRLLRIARLRVVAAHHGVELLRRTGDRVLLGGPLDGLAELEPYSLPLRPIEPDTAMLVLPREAPEESILGLLERFFRCS